MSLHWDDSHSITYVDLEKHETEPTIFFRLEKYAETDSWPILSFSLQQYKTEQQVRKWKRCKAFQDLVAEITEYMGRTLVHVDEKLILLRAIRYFNQDLFDDNFPVEDWESVWRIMCRLL